MKKLIILLSISFLFAGNLINVNFFPHKRFVDILLSLDEKFTGKVQKIADNEFYISGISNNKTITKTFENFFIRKITISPYKEGVKILISASEKFTTSVALTPEGYGIRFRIEKIKAQHNEVKDLMAQNPAGGIDYTAYIVSVAILIILAIILWIMRKKMPKLPVKKEEMKKLNMGMLVQKPLDPKNKVVLFEFNGRKYLILVGNSNILLDVFDENMVHISPGKFENGSKEFDEFLKLQNKMDEIKKYIKNAEELKEFDERI